MGRTEGSGESRHLENAGMSGNKTQRVRDPVHGLIVFRGDEPLDQLAWRLLDTQEFQRLRRIKQLGVSEFVFPNATHTRFAHSVGVFHTARTLVEIIRREVAEYEPLRAEVAVIAALLHDIGHGPFSHTFENVQKSRDVKKRHEQWTADMIRNPEGGIRPLLDAYREDGSFTEEVAGLLEAEDPADIYHAVVSSSFDADRLDYLRRDRFMTGTGAGAIDFDWLMEQVRVREIAMEPAEADVDDDDPDARVATFCLDAKALPAAEQFLLARFTLHEQVYFHKTTRCVEQMIAKLLRRIATLAMEESTAAGETGLAPGHALLRFFGKDGETLANYAALDDAVIVGSLGAMRGAADSEVADMAGRLLDRRLYKTLDLRAFGSDKGRQARAERRIEETFAAGLADGTVLKDKEAAVTIYTQIGGDDDKMHKKLHILDASKPREITDLSDMIKALGERRSFTRYYFANDEDRQQAMNPRRSRV